MAFKFTVGASLLMTACVALSGCQSTPSRTTNPSFTQRPGSANPPVVVGNQQPGVQPLGSQQPAPSNGMAMQTNSVSPATLGSIPTATPATTGSQFRSTQQPVFPNSGPGSANFVTSPPPAGFNTSAPGFDMPPANPGFGNAPPVPRP
jgi:hypothetical protein